jgi:hypothetical protein
MSFYDQARACFKQNLQTIGVPVPVDYMTEYNLSSGLDCLVDAIQADLQDIRSQQAQIVRLLESLVQSK